MPYDWRLSYAALERRDGYFSRLKSQIEALHRLNDGRKVVLLAHSMGSPVLHYFFNWLTAPAALGGAGTPGDWTARHIEAQVHLGGAHLGVPKAVSALLSGEMKDTAEMSAWLAGLRQRALLSNLELTGLFRGFHSVASMFPKGGDGVWGGDARTLARRPDDGDGVSLSAAETYAASSSLFDWPAPDATPLRVGSCVASYEQELLSKLSIIPSTNSNADSDSSVASRLRAGGRAVPGGEVTAAAVGAMTDAATVAKVVAGAAGAAVEAPSKAAKATAAAAAAAAGAAVGGAASAARAALAGVVNRNPSAIGDNNAVDDDGADGDEDCDDGDNDDIAGPQDAYMPSSLRHAAAAAAAAADASYRLRPRPNKATGDDSNDNDEPGFHPHARPAVARAASAPTLTRRCKRRGGGRMRQSAFGQLSRSAQSDYYVFLAMRELRRIAHLPTPGPCSLAAWATLEAVETALDEAAIARAESAAAHRVLVAAPHGLVSATQAGDGPDAAAAAADGAIAGVELAPDWASKRRRARFHRYARLMRAATAAMREGDEGDHGDGHDDEQGDAADGDSARLARRARSLSRGRGRPAGHSAAEREERFGESPAAQCSAIAVELLARLQEQERLDAAAAFASSDSAFSAAGGAGLSTADSAAAVSAPASSATGAAPAVGDGVEGWAASSRARLQSILEVTLPQAVLDSYFDQDVPLPAGARDVAAMIVFSDVHTLAEADAALDAEEANDQANTNKVNAANNSAANTSSNGINLAGSSAGAKAETEAATPDEVCQCPADASANASMADLAAAPVADAAVAAPAADAATAAAAEPAAADNGTSGSADVASKADNVATTAAAALARVHAAATTAASAATTAASAAATAAAAAAASALPDKLLQLMDREEGTVARALAAEARRTLVEKASRPLWAAVRPPLRSAAPATNSTDSAGGSNAARAQSVCQCVGAGVSASASAPATLREPVSGLKPPARAPFPFAGTGATVTSVAQELLPQVAPRFSRFLHSSYALTPLTPPRFNDTANSTSQASASSSASASATSDASTHADGVDLSFLMKPPADGSRSIFANQAAMYAQRAWSDPLLTPLPHAPDMRVYDIYGVGKPAERGYVYRLNPDPLERRFLPFLIDTRVSSNENWINRGVRLTDGDGTVPLVSLGYMVRLI